MRIYMNDKMRLAVDAAAASVEASDYKWQSRWYFCGR